MKTHTIIRRPLITEKGSSQQAAANQYFFEVDKKATKYDIRKAIEDLFDVDVKAVRTMNVLGKKKRVGRNIGMTRDWKKAIVTLKEGDKIEFLEGK